MSLCKIEKCEKNIHAKGYCSKHYRRLHRFNTLKTNKGPTTDTDLSLKERFDLSFIPVTESGCWIWDMYLNPEGYGRLHYKGKRKMAHAVSYELYNGSIKNGLCVLHKCDTRSCVNPSHLFIGTRADNNEDKMKKGRHKSLPGELNGMAKLSNDQIKRIMTLLDKGTNIFEIAKLFKVSKTTIRRIKNGERKAA